MITVYGREGCESCELLKNQLRSSNIKFKYVDVDNMNESEISELIRSNNGSETLPIVIEE